MSGVSKTKVSLLEICPEAKDWLINIEDGHISSGSARKIQFCCLKCRSNFSMAVYNFNYGQRCPYCCSAPRKVNETNWAYNNEEMRQWAVNPELLKSFNMSANKKIEWKCIKCCSVFESTLNTFHHGNRCSYCRGLKVNSTNWAFNNKNMRRWAENPELLKSLTVASDKKIEWRCIKCNSKFISKLANFHFNNSRCPYCCPTPRKVNETNWAYANETMRQWALYPELLKTLTVSSNKKIEWKCISCDTIFISRLNDFNKGSRCPKCNESKGEKYISSYLENNNIIYTRQHKITECRNLKMLPFDHAIWKKDELIGLIEFHGSQHYQPIEFFGGERTFKLLQKRDKIKEDYCKENNIPLLIIPYNEPDIDKVLKNFLINLGFEINKSPELQ